MIVMVRCRQSDPLMGLIALAPLRVAVDWGSVSAGPSGNGESLTWR